MPFFHLSVTDRLVDIFASLNLIPPKKLERERELAESKWYAYRFMSPMAATKHFADAYRKGVKAYAREHQDRDLAESVQGLGRNVFGKPSSSLTELWGARQRADELGLSYDLLVEFGMYFAGRRTWRHTPRPIQLFGSKESDVAWRHEIEKFLEEREPAALSRIAELPQYRTECYRGLPAQDAFRAELLDGIRKNTRSRSIEIGRQCVETRHLPMLSTLKLAPSELRAGVVSDIRHDLNIGLLTPAPKEKLPLIAYAPPCFGLPHARDVGSEQCLACPMSVACEAAALKVTKRMIERHGVLSPLQEGRDSRRREMTRRRVAKLRAKKSELAGSWGWV